MNTNTQKLEAIIAREIIELGKEYSADPNILESLSEICFTFSRFMEATHQSDTSVVDWDDIFSAYDQAYTALNAGQSPASHSLEKEYQKVTKIIKNN